MSSFETIFFFLLLLPPLITLLLAMDISLKKTVHQMIPLYKWQLGLLILITIFTAIQRATYILLIFLFIPIALLVVIEAMLAQATVAEDLHWWKRLRRLFIPRIQYITQRQAIPIWQMPRATWRGEIPTLLINIGLILLAYIIAFHLIFPNLPSNYSTLIELDKMPYFAQTNSLAIALALLLVGLVTMTRKQDVISQIMGLLVMEQGMYLAVVEIAGFSGIVILFIFGLLLYIFITLTILVVLMPELHSISRSIVVDDQKELKG